MGRVEANLSEALAAARREFGAGRLREAAQRFRRLVKRAPGWAEAWYWLGRCKLYNREFKRAEAALLQAVSLDPDLADAWKELGVLYRRRGRLADAVRALKNALTGDFNRADFWLELGQVYTQQQEHEKAFRALRRAVHLRPNWKEAQMLLGFSAAYLAEIITIREVDEALERMMSAEELKNYWRQLVRIMGC